MKGDPEGKARRESQDPAYDDEIAVSRLQLALDISNKCDPTTCNCETCLISKPIQLLAHDSGVKIVASLCSMIIMLKEAAFDPEEFKYTEW